MASKKDGRRRAAERAATVHEAKTAGAPAAAGEAGTAAKADLPSLGAVRAAFPDYKKTRTYLGMGAGARRALAAYAREGGVSDDAIFYQLYLRDLSNLDEDEKKRASQPSEYMLVGAIVFAVAMVAMQQPVPIFIATGTLIVMTILFFSGVLNPIQSERRRTRRWLKRNLSAPAFEDWDA